MAVLLRSKSSRDTHPPIGAGLDLGHPLVQGLHLYAPFNELGGQTAQDLRRGNHLRPATGTAAWSPRGLACPSDGSLRLETARNIGISGNQKLTYGAWFLTGAETGLAAISHHVFNIGVATNDNMSHLILLKPTSDDTLWIPKYGAWGFDNNANTGIRDGKPHLVVVVYDGTKYLCYIDGHLDATSGAYSTLNITDATMAFGQYRGGGSTFGYQGRTWGAFVATRAWSQSDVEWLYTEPYAFLQPQSPRVRRWIAPSTVSTISATFAAPLGALTASITATVEHPATFAAPLGGLSAAATATPEHPAVLAAPLGGLSASITATPVHPATLDAPLGGLSASITATVTHPAVLVADLGGLTAAISATPEHPATLDAPLGSLTGTISAGPEHAATLDAPLGALVATAAAALEHPATFDAPLGPLTATAPFVISHQALLDAQLGGLVANIAPTVQRQALFSALLGGLHGAIVISQPDLNPLHFIYQEPSFAVTYTESSTIEHREPATSFVYQEH